MPTGSSEVSSHQVQGITQEVSRPTAGAHFVFVQHGTENISTLNICSVCCEKSISSASHSKLFFYNFFRDFDKKEKLKDKKIDKPDKTVFLIQTYITYVCVFFKAANQVLIYVLNVSKSDLFFLSYFLKEFFQMSQS